MYIQPLYTHSLSIPLRMKLVSVPNHVFNHCISLAIPLYTLEKKKPFQ